MLLGDTTRAVLGWEGFYAVTDDGRVLSLARRHVPQTHYLAQTLDTRGHPKVLLNDRPGGRRETTRVHRMVLEAFVGPRPEGMQACHNDGDPTNNHVSNLRWDTASANVLDQVRHGVHNMASKTHCKNGHPFDEANTYLYDGRRKCKACMRAASKRNNWGRPKRHAPVPPTTRGEL